MTTIVRVGSLALVAMVMFVQVHTAPSVNMATAAQVPQCQTAQLRGSIGLQTGGAGSVFTTLVLRNAGHSACALIGYPGVSLVDRQHRQIGRAATWVGGGAVRWIVLQPGGAASTVIRSLNPGITPPSCLPASAALRVYPPNQWTSLYVPARLTECLGTLEVKPLVAGTHGQL